MVARQSSSDSFFFLKTKLFKDSALKSISPFSSEIFSKNCSDGSSIIPVGDEVAQEKFILVQKDLRQTQYSDLEVWAKGERSKGVEFFQASIDCWQFQSLGQVQDISGLMLEILLFDILSQGFSSLK